MKITKAQLKETLRTIMKEESEYQQFFRKALDKAGKSITDMSDEEKKAFFTKIDAAWDGKGEKNEGNAFGAAVTAAKEKGEDEFKVGDKTYKVESVNKPRKLKIGKEDFSYLLKLTDKELVKKLNSIRKQYPINYQQYTDAKSKGQDTSKIEKEAESLQTLEKAVIAARSMINFESVNEIANSKGYKPKDAFGARIIQAIDTNIKESNPKTLKRDGLSNEEILEYGKTFLQVVRNGIKAAFQFKYKIHPDVEFPMRRPKGHYWRFESREDMEKYLKVFLADLKKLDSMIVSYLQKPTLKAQQQICDFWNWDMLVDSSRTGGFADGIMNSVTSKQSFYESVNEEKYTVIDPMGNQKGAGLKMQAAAMAKKLGGEKTGHFVVANKNALKARRALEKFKGDFKNPKLKDMMADLFYESVITEALVPVDKKAVDAFFDKKPFEGKNLNSDGKVLKTVGVGSQEMFIHTPNGVKFVGKITGQYAQSVVQYVNKNHKSDLSETITEGRAFINAAKKAKAEGKTEFEFNGKTYPVTIKD